MRRLVMAWAAMVLVWITAGRTQNTPRGQDTFERRCTGCHALDRNKEGPQLSGVFGRAAGTAPGFEYSDALKKSGIVWNADNLDKWLTDTDKVVPGNDMAFHVESAAERSDIIDYLKQLPH